MNTNARWIFVATQDGFSEALGHTSTRADALALMRLDAGTCVPTNGNVTFQDREHDVAAVFADGTEIVYVIEPLQAAEEQFAAVIDEIGNSVGEYMAALRQRQVTLSTERACRNGNPAYLEVSATGQADDGLIELNKCVGSVRGTPEWVNNWKTALTVDEAHTLIDRLNAAIREIGGED